MKRKSKQLKQVNSKLEINDCVAENMRFAAKIPAKSVKVFINIIKAVLNATNLTDASEMQLSETGIKYIVEESKSFQASTYIKKKFFDSYTLKVRDQNNPVISFGVNLKSFTDLLSGILNDDLSGMHMVYYGNKECVSFSCKQVDNVEPLKEKFDLLSDNTNETSDDFEPIEITTEYFVKTMESVEPIDFNATTSEVVHSIIISANEFHGIINDFDRTIDEVEIKVTEQRMTLKSVGVLQYATLVKLDPKSELFYKYECIEPSKFLYKFSYFKAMLKSLTMASKASVITHADGMMRIQLMVQNDEEVAAAFIEYNMLANLPDDDEMEEI